MRTKWAYLCIRCAKENTFCVVYLVGLTLALSFVTTLILGGGFVTFGGSLLALSLLVLWYLRACYAHHSDSKR